jgi:2-methylcitrate dehydratase PrpD
MPENPETKTPSVQEVQAKLHEVARILQKSTSLDAEAQQILAELVDELGVALQASNTPPAEVARLAASAAHLAEALHHQRDQGFLGKARDRLGAAVLQAEAKAPVPAGLARRLLDVLANIGI